MSWITSSQCTVACNDPRHVGTREQTVTHGASLSAMEALKATGWHYEGVTQRHTCPECTTINRARALFQPGGRR